MSNRKTIRTVIVNVTEDEQRSFVLEYSILEKEVYIEGTSANTYGIEVLKREKTILGTLRVEYRKIFDVFCTEQEATNAIHLLADNTVTPVSCHDIVEQLIGTDEIVCEEYEVLAV